MSSSTDISTTINELASLSSPKLAEDDKSRREALALARKLTNLLEDPRDKVMGTFWSPWLNIAARIGADYDIYRTLVASNEPLSTDQLVKSSGGADRMTLIRVLRLLAAADFLRQVSEDMWAATPTTEALATRGLTAANRFLFDMLIGAAITAPRYLREKGAGAPFPTDPEDGLWQYAHGVRTNAWDTLAVMPDMNRDFNDFMGHTLGDREGFWAAFYPVEARLLDGFDPATTLLVDVGGGRGHDSLAFYQHFHNRYEQLTTSSANGDGVATEGVSRQVLQDLPRAIDGIAASDLPAAIERQRHDFFTEQPVRGARAYYLHHILHDWSDEQCVRILRPLAAAMVRGYSRLLINELVLPDAGVSVFESCFDLTMMAFSGGMQRSEKQWRHLLNAVGLQVVGFYTPERDCDGIIEAELK